MWLTKELAGRTERDSYKSIEFHIALLIENILERIMANNN